MCRHCIYKYILHIHSVVLWLCVLDAIFKLFSLNDNKIVDGREQPNNVTKMEFSVIIIMKMSSGSTVAILLLLCVAGAAAAETS